MAALHMRVVTDAGSAKKPLSSCGHGGSGGCHTVYILKLLPQMLTRCQVSSKGWLHMLEVELSSADLCAVYHEAANISSPWCEPSEAGRKKPRPRNAMNGAKGRPQYSLLDSSFGWMNQS